MSSTYSGGALSFGGSSFAGGTDSGGRSQTTGSVLVTGGATNAGTSSVSSTASGTGGMAGSGGSVGAGGTQFTLVATFAGGTSNTTNTHATGSAASTGGLPSTGGTRSATTNAGGTTALSTTGAGGNGGVVTGVGSCSAPCAASYQPNDSYIGEDSGASLFYDMATGQFTLRNNPDQAPANSLEIVMFTFSSDYGYSLATTGSMWFEYIDNFAYSTDYTGYSVKLNTAMTAHEVDVATGYTYIVDFKIGSQSVTVTGARIASCDPTKATTCQSTADCPQVTSGQIAGVSPGCAACYTAFQSCSDTNCAVECPGQGGNDCMSCQIDNECHTAFLACSGLDYMPAGTLTLPMP